MKIRKTALAGRSRSAEDWIYGLNPVLETIRSGREVKTIFVSLSRHHRLGEIEEEAGRRGIRLRKVDTLFFDSRFPKGHQGIAALVAPREFLEIEELLSLPERRGEQPLFLVLDCVDDPRNFGAILRVADAGGIHGVVIQAHRSATLGPEALKASAGAAEYMPVSVVANIKHAMRLMKDRGIMVVGAEAGEGESLWHKDFSVPMGLVVGSEGKGLRRTVKEECDTLVSIPMHGAVNSLNVAVASAVLIFEIMRQRSR